MTIESLLSISPGVGLLISSVVITLALRWWSHEFWQEKLRIWKFAKTLPGPDSLPILGNILWKTDETVKTFRKIGQQINSRFYHFWTGPIVKIIISEPKDLEIALMSAKTTNKDDVYRFMEPAVINGLINAPGSSYYRTHKNLMMPQINGNSVMRKYIETFNHQSRLLVKLMKEKVGAGEFDVHDHLTFCLGDIVFESLFGIPGTAQLGEPSVLVSRVQTCLHNVYYRMCRPWLYPSCLFRLTARGREYYTIVKEVHKFVDGIIADKKKNYQPLNQETETAKLSLCDFLIDHTMKNKDWTDEEIRYQMITIFIGSYETISGLASFALLMMAMHPKVQENAREEIKYVVRTDDVSEREIADLKYVEMIIKETIRMFPVGPLLPRKVNADLKMSSCTVPKGTSLLLFPYGTHMDREFWDEPEKFNPERFTPENSRNRHPYAYIPFSGGLRSCPGTKYGMVCTKIILAHVVKNYHLSTTMKLETLNVNNHISSTSADGYKIALKPI